MRQWSSFLGWDRLRNWLPGVFGVSAVIIMAIVAGNSSTTTNSRSPVSLSTEPSAAATEGQTDTASPSQPALPQTSPRQDKSAQVQDHVPSTLPTTSPVAAPKAANPGSASDQTRPQAPRATPTQAQSSSSAAGVQQQNAVDAGGSQGDVAAGRQVFKKCQACHSLEPGKAILGPSLSGIIGRKAGSDPNFSYSPALKKAALTWDAATLDTYLLDPQTLVSRRTGQLFF